MRVKKCPYCGKRVSYSTAYSSRRNGEYRCGRCGKESKVKIDVRIYLMFALAAVISIAIMAGWIFAGFVSNFFGVILVSVPLIIFSFITPNFIYYEPLRKYKKSMEARKEGIAYSDNLIISDFDDKENLSFSKEGGENFKINSDVFNKIKAERNASREQFKGENLISDSDKISPKQEQDDYVPVINNVSQNHVSVDAPLRKIRSESKQSINRMQHYIPIKSDSSEGEKRKTDGNRYSANRKF